MNNYEIKYSNVNGIKSFQLILDKSNGWSGKPGSLDNDLQSIGVNIDVIIYWYNSGSYEGDGHALIKTNDKWFMHNLSHCSCNGPLDDGNTFRSEYAKHADSPSEFIKTMSKEAYDSEWRELIEVAQIYDTSIQELISKHPEIIL